jgi:hypothetical protein
MGDDLDPFGRRKDENPLASLGWHDGGDGDTAEPEPEPEPEPVTMFGASDAAATEPVATFGAAAPPSADAARTPPSLAEPDAHPAHRGPPRGHDHARAARRAQRRPFGRLIRTLVVLVVLIAVIGSVIGALVDEGVERADRFAREFAPPDIEVPRVPGADGESATGDGASPQRPPTGLSSGSLLRPAAFGRAIARLRTGGYGRLGNLRVAPERIDATLVTKDGRLRQVQIVPGGAVRVIGTTSAGFARAHTMTMHDIVAAAPSRLTRSAAGRLGVPAGRVNYLVLSSFAGTRQWNVYFKGGQIFSADPRGRITRRNS